MKRIDGSRLAAAGAEQQMKTEQSHPYPLPSRRPIPAELIGFDIDGVVADTMEAFIRLARDEHGIDTIEPGQITDFLVEECLDVDPRIVTAIFERLLAAPVDAGLLPMAGAVATLNELAGSAPLTFITARPQPEPINRWLHSVLARTAYDSMRLVATGEHDNKAEAIRRLGLRYFVDDRAETCVGLARQGIQSFVFSQPWNHGKHRLPSVAGWQDIRCLCGLESENTIPRAASTL